MALKKYQINAVRKLYTKALNLLALAGTRTCVFKAPTGSGKTIMVAEFLKQLADARLDRLYAFVWISSNNLHVQSMEKVSEYLADSSYSFTLLEDMSNTTLQQNQIAFVNWESLTKQDKQTGNFINVLMPRTNRGNICQISSPIQREMILRLS